MIPIESEKLARVILEELSDGSLSASEVEELEGEYNQYSVEEGLESLVDAGLVKEDSRGERYWVNLSGKKAYEEVFRQRYPEEELPRYLLNGGDYRRFLEKR